MTIYNILGICRFRKYVTKRDMRPTDKGGQLHMFYFSSIKSKLTEQR
jgi:hypothetical protein